MKGVILGVDPGYKHAGWVILGVNGQDRMVECGYFSYDNRRQRLSKMKSIIMKAEEQAKITGGGLYLVVEDQYFARNVKVLAKLVEGRVTWEVLAELRALRGQSWNTVRVSGARWQRDLLIHKGEKVRQIGRDKVKERAMKLAKTLVREESIKKQQDIADAVCIALWAAEQMKEGLL